jgi:hypothetical protein
MRETPARPADLGAEKVARFGRDGFIAFRQLFCASEIAELSDTFMATAKYAPIEGLSEVKAPAAGGQTSPCSPDDPVRFYPRMLHPHKHSDKPVGPLSMKYMLHPKLEQILKALFAAEPVAVQGMFYFKPPVRRYIRKTSFYRSSPAPVSQRGSQLTPRTWKTVACNAYQTPRAIRSSIPKKQICRIPSRPSR